MSPFSPLQQLHRLETSSSQFPAQITSILDGTEYNVWIQSFQEGDLSQIVEYLDNVLCTSDSTSPVFRICLRELRRICGIYHILPPSYTIPDFPLDISCGPTVRGFYGDIREGSLNNSTVRVKRLFTPSEEGQNCKKNFYEEAVTWKHLEHPNIVSLLGVTITAPPFQLVSDWISGEDLTRYIGNNPGADELRLLSGTTNGLEYLHSHDVVHGNLKGSNILVDDSGRVRITDFGLATVPQGSDPKRGLLDEHNARWAAPEILDGLGMYSKEADIFAFAMVMIEVFTGAVPFDRSPLTSAMMAIMRGDRPRRPTNTACSDELWAIMQRCWDQEPRLRPEVSEVTQVLRGSTLNRLRRLHTHGMASHEFQCALTQFYCSTGYKDRMNGLKDPDERKFVEFLYEVLWTKGLNQSLLQQTLHGIRRVCGHRAIVPGSCVVSDALYQVDRSSRVRTWKLKRNQGGANQNDVRVNITKAEKTRKELYGEVVTWAWLDHPNILPCFGITLDPFQVVTEWVPHRNVVEYVQTHTNVDRVCLLIDIVQGLHYLHSYEVIHQNLKPENILVNAAGRAQLSDIGFITSTHDEALDVDNTESSVYYRWRAPEVLKDGRFSKPSDIFSFGFVAAEILVGEILWRGVGTMEIKSKIFYGERPRMPKGKAELGVTAEIWGMLTKCWEAEAEDRITISGVLSFLQYVPQPISGSSYNFGEATARSRRPPDQEFIDKLDEILERDEVSDQERTGFLNILCKMCSRQQSVPKSMRIDCRGSEQTDEVYRGGQGSVFKGEDRGHLVAVKVVRLYINGLEKCLSRFYREAVVWKHLRHPNILPLLGVDVNLGNQKYAMVSEWMDNGNINEFTQKNKEVNRVQLLVDVAFGLEYMHGLQFVHADLKGANILITKAGRACLADFGLTTIISGASAASTSTTSLMSFTEGGTTRWMSPELLHPERFGAKGFRPTAQSDCYALGMVVYEVLLGKPPYWEITDRHVVMDAIMRGVRPKKPYRADSFGFTDGLWRIIERSWIADIDARPDVKTMLYHFNHAASVWNKKRLI